LIWNLVLTAFSQSPRAAQFALIFITMIWGGTFLAVQYALNFSTPMFFVGCFAVAAGVIFLLSLKSMSGLTLKETLAGTAIGIMIAIGYGTQTIGLQSILSSESAFLTALYVPLVPILMWVIFQKSPSLMTWIGSALAFTGLVLLTGNGFSNISLLWTNTYPDLCFGDCIRDYFDWLFCRTSKFTTCYCNSTHGCRSTLFRQYAFGW
jgi:drug/metabolite transporter (DMT)-like permease